jgi:TP901 family phage tail tape measure protein
MASAGEISVLLTLKKAMFGKQMKSVTKSFEQLGVAASAAFGAIKIGQGLMIKTAAEFEQGMVRVAAVSQASQSQYRAMEKAALSMAAKTQYTAREVADGMGFLAMAGYNATQVVEAMPHALDLAAAGMIGIADASNIVTNVMAGMGLQMEDLARANDTIVSAITGANVDVSMLGEAFKYVGPVAKTAGASFEDVTAALGERQPAEFVSNNQ